MFNFSAKGCFIFMAAIIAVMISLTGCGDSQAKKSETFLRSETAKAASIAAKSIDTLEKEIKAGNVTNANLIIKYSDLLVKKEPSLSVIIEEIKKEGTITGPTLNSLKRRLSENQSLFTATVKTLSDSGNSDSAYGNASRKYIQDIQPEYDRLIGAAFTEAYNEALGDYVNMLADMSKDTLPRVDGKKSSDFYKETGASNIGAATMLVGNDNYGTWKKDSSGTSFWEFYGQYALMSSLLNMGNGGQYHYSDWNRSRPYSAYNDYYSQRYSPSSIHSRNTSLKGYTGSSSGISPSQKYMQSNPTVSKKFEKLDNQFASKRPGSNAVVSRGIANSAPNTTSKVTANNKLSSQFDAKKPAPNSQKPSTTTSKPSSSGTIRNSSSGSRSSGRGK